MIGPRAGTRVWLAAGVTDMRCGMDTLAAKVQTALIEDPYSGHVFVFRGRRGDRIAAMKDRQVTLLDEQSKQRFSVLYAAIVPLDDQQEGTSPSPTLAAPLRPPPEIHHKQDFRVGQRVSFTDQSLKRHVGEIVRINQRTATVHCDGRAWRVAFALLQHVTDITP